MILNRHTLLSATCFCAVAASQLASGAGLPQELIACRALTSAVARLDCYDQAIDSHDNSVSASENVPATAPAAAAATAPTAVEPAEEISQEALFGKNMVEMQQSVQKATKTQEIDEIISIVTKVRESATGKAVIYLDNGQVWTQIDSARLRLSGYDKVSIRRASLGSYLLYKDGSKTSMRVKRIS